MLTSISRTYPRPDNLSLRGPSQSVVLRGVFPSSDRMENSCRLTGRWRVFYRRSSLERWPKVIPSHPFHTLQSLTSSWMWLFSCKAVWVTAPWPSHVFLLHCSADCGADRNRALTMASAMMMKGLESLHSTQIPPQCEMTDGWSPFTGMLKK